MKDQSLAAQSKPAWDLIIKPKPRLLDLRFNEVWRYRDLMLLLVKRDFIAQYKQTVLGPVWHLIQPILTTLMFLLVFSNIAKIPTDGIHPIVFYLSGIVVWNYFSLCLLNISNTFLTNANIFGKVYFPRLVMPLSVSLSNLIRFGIQFMLLMGAMIWFHFKGYPIHLTFKWVAIPLLVILVAGIALGLGIIISSFTTKYRDFAVLLTFAIQLGVYATPIAYPMSYLRGRSYETVIKLNPLSSIVETFRYVLFDKGTFNVGDLLYSTVFMIVLVLVGIILFNRIEKKFMDTV